MRSEVPAPAPPAKAYVFSPLVDEVNALLDAQEREVERSRGRAADLAHGLKTPLAALAADAERLRRHGDMATASQIEVATEQMRRHVERELAHARIRSRLLRTIDVSTPLRPIIETLVATLSRTPQGEVVRFEIAIPGDAIAPFDRTDLAEVLGNLLENAARYARSHVRITVSSGPAGIRIAIEDDGPGIDPAARSAVLKRGARLDERGSAGLGLAIVQDVLEAYGWTLDLTTSELGGLRAMIAPDASSAQPRADQGASLPPSLTNR